MQTKKSDYSLRRIPDLTFQIEVDQLQHEKSVFSSCIYSRGLQNVCVRTCVSLYVCVCFCVHAWGRACSFVCRHPPPAHMCTHTWRSEDSFQKPIIFLDHHVDFWGSNSGQQVWWQTLKILSQLTKPPAAMSERERI